MVSQLYLIPLLVTFSSGCLRVQKVNECGCFDYNPLTRSRILSIDPNYELSGKLTAPQVTYTSNCTYIEIRCPPVNGTLRNLIRTNWPERDFLYTTNMNTYSYTTTLWFDVECDRKTHEWKYTAVDDDREIVNEHLACHVSS